MKVIRFVGLLFFIVVATSWSYIGVFSAARNPTLLPALLFGVVCMFSLIISLLHKEVFE